jgi:hypothetical protein
VVNTLGCSATSLQQVVTVNPLPSAPIVVLMGNLTFCAGDSVLLGTTAMAGNTYQWLRNSLNIPGATSSSYPATTSGSYQIKVSDANCSNLSTVEVATALQVPSDTILLTGKPVICGSNGSCVLAAVPVNGQTYAWYENGILINGANAFQYSAVTQGIYNVMVTNTQGCTIFSKPVSITLVNNPSVNINAAGNILNATPGYVTYSWSLNGNVITGANSMVYNATQNGTYAVTVTDTNGCMGTSDDYILSGLNIKQVNVNPADISIYPNPASSMVHINAPVAIKVIISSLEGKEVLTQEGAQTIDISSLPNGIYLLKIFDAENTLLKTERLVKNNY